MIITTSWDDGFPADLKLMNLLLKYGIKSTFYIPIKNSENEILTASEIKEIGSHFDVGGHTFNHLYLNKLNKNQSREEIYTCKVELEQLLQRKINSFCFPGGKFKTNDIDLVKSAGFSFARTTRLFGTKNPLDGFLMNTSYQIFNHTKLTLNINLLKQGRILDIFEQHGNSLLELVSRDIHFFGKESDYCLHLWGHSWELEKYNLWYDLEEIFKYIVNSGEHTYLDNFELYRILNK
jgi:peptidoglycan/xylan/chitin deacetylase (PgdA/CDA1 family)